MSEKAIRKLRQRFIISAVGALAGTMLILAGLICLFNIQISQRSLENTLDYIIANDGELVNWDDVTNNDELEQLRSEWDRIIDSVFDTSLEIKSRDSQYIVRYFVLRYDEDDNLDDADLDNIYFETSEEVIKYGQTALDRRGDFGRIDHYYYKKTTLDDGEEMIVFLDASRTIRANNRIVYIAISITTLGMWLSFFLVNFFSKKAIAPELENAELQKQFITNISHELKTPLAVIRANTEMSEMMDGENEWNESTLRQIDRMDGLIKNLVMISKAEEMDTQDISDEIDVSAVMLETVDNFKAMAKRAHIEYEINVENNVKMVADAAHIRQLASLLVDNALKYCDENGNVSVLMFKRGKGIYFSVSNTYEAGKDVDYTRFFERFYREDASHNTDKGGYGIGLSVAESITKMYHGTINATYKAGVITFACVLKKP